jgi:hypothetical protein
MMTQEFIMIPKFITLLIISTPSSSREFIGMGRIDVSIGVGVRGPEFGVHDSESKKIHCKFPKSPKNKNVKKTPKKFRPSSKKFTVNFQKARKIKTSKKHPKKFRPSSKKIHCKFTKKPKK